MKKEKDRIGAAVFAYSLAMLLLMTLTALFFFRKASTSTEITKAPTTETIRYVYVTLDSGEESTAASEENSVWIVKEHELRVGVFTEDGILLRILDIYTNTLPEADRRMLREGITVTTRSALYALIEDYSE